MEEKNNLPAMAKNEIAVTDKELTNYLTAMGLANKLSEAEKLQFLSISKAWNLNPFKREIYATKYGENFSIVVGYESYIKKAERTNLLNGWKVTTTGDVKDNSLKAIVKIFRKGWAEPFEHEIYYSEYVQKTKDGSINKFWREKPITMTKKVAISQAFRLCFSEEIGGMPYTAEEITEETVYAEIIEPKKQKIGAKAFMQAIERIKAGEPDLIEKLEATYQLTEEQINELNQITA